MTLGSINIHSLKSTATLWMLRRRFYFNKISGLLWPSPGLHQWLLPQILLCPCPGRPPAGLQKRRSQTKNKKFPFLRSGGFSLVSLSAREWTDMNSQMETPDTESKIREEWELLRVLRNISNLSPHIKKNRLRDTVRPFYSYSQTSLWSGVFPSFTSIPSLVYKQSKYYNKREYISSLHISS